MVPACTCVPWRPHTPPSAPETAAFALANLARRLAVPKLNRFVRKPRKEALQAVDKARADGAARGRDAVQFQVDLAAKNNADRVELLTAQITQFKEQAQRRFQTLEQQVRAGRRAVWWLGWRAVACACVCASGCPACLACRAPSALPTLVRLRGATMAASPELARAYCTSIVLCLVAFGAPVGVVQVSEERTRKEAAYATARESSERLENVVQSQLQMLPALIRDIEAVESNVRKCLAQESQLEVRVWMVGSRRGWGRVSVGPARCAQGAPGAYRACRPSPGCAHTQAL